MANEASRDEVGEILQICWAIWKGRNKFVFNGEIPKPEEVITQALTAAKGFLQAVCSGNQRGLPRLIRVLKWDPPPTSFTKINIDGAFKSSRSSAAFGIIARDSGGCALLWRCGRVMVSSALAIEAWALCIACVLAKEQKLKEVIFESDCQYLISYVNGDMMNFPWKIAAFVEDIRTWAASESWSFKWWREANKVAHWIASQCRDRKILFASGCIPPGLESVLIQDSS